MNMDFLNRQACKKSAALTKIQAQLNDEFNIPSSGEPVASGLFIVSEGVYAASSGLNTTGAIVTTNVVAASMGIAAELLSMAILKRSRVSSRELLRQQSGLILGLETRVGILYTRLKQGSLQARNQLVGLTDESCVHEVENNLKLEHP